MKNLIPYNEWKKSDTNRYIRQISNFYNDESFVEDILQGEKGAFYMVGNDDVKTLITDNDNLIVRYVENESIICLLGLTTESGNILRSDLKEIYIFGEELLNKIEQGKTLITFPNDVSELLIDKMIEIGKKKGIELSKESSMRMDKEVEGVESKFLRYKMIVVKKI